MANDFNPFVDRNRIDFEFAPSVGGRIRMAVRSAIRALPPSILLVDLSHWNGTVDFARLRASGVQAVILKCSEGAEGTYYEFKDPKFETNWRASLDEGFPVMVYHFFRDNKGFAEKDWFMKCADVFLNDARINGKTAAWLDVEWTGSGLSVDARSSRAFGFCDLIKGEGMRQGIYSSPGLVSRLFPPNDVRWQNVNGWNAHWTSAPEYTLPSGWSHDMVKGWQFGIYDDHSWTPKVDGAGDVDVNKFFFATEAELRLWLEQGTGTIPPPTHDHEELQRQIDEIKADLTRVYDLIAWQHDEIEDLEARDIALTSDIEDICKRLQEASNALAGGGE